MSVRRLGGCERSEPAPTRPASRPPTATKPLEKESLETARVLSVRGTTDRCRCPAKIFEISVPFAGRNLFSPRDAAVIGSALCSSFLDEFAVNENCETGVRTTFFPPGDWSVGGHNRARRPRASSVTRAFTPGVAPHVERACSHRGSRAKRRVRHPSAGYGAPALARQTWVTASAGRCEKLEKIGRGTYGKVCKARDRTTVVWWR